MSSTILNSLHQVSYATPTSPAEFEAFTKEVLDLADLKELNRKGYLLVNEILNVDYEYQHEDGQITTEYANHYAFISISVG